MNWLAHLFLSTPSPAFRIGNLLPDILRRHELVALPSEFQRGIRCHLDIDRFTDAHPVVRRSLGRIEPPFRRYGGILIDVFYDHFLATAWDGYATISLPTFVAEVHASFDMYRPELPPLANIRLRQIRDGGWLASYQEFSGIRRALSGLGSRLRRPYELGEAVTQLERHYESLRDDFEEFFPVLQEHTQRTHLLVSSSPLPTITGPIDR